MLVHILVSEKDNVNRKSALVKNEC